MRRTPLLPLYAAVLIDAAGYGMVVPLLPLYAGELGVRATGVGLLTALYAAAQLVSLPAIGALADRRGPRAVLLGCIFGTALAYAALALASSPALLVCALLLDALTGGNLSVAQALAAEHTPPQGRAQALARLGAAFGLGVVAGPALGGALAALDLRAPLWAAAALGLANVLVGVWLLPGDPPGGRRAAAAEPGGLRPWALVRTAVLGAPELRRPLLALFLLNLAFAGLLSTFPLFSAARFGWGAPANGALYAAAGLAAVLAQGVLVGLLEPRLGARRLAAGGLVALAGGLAAVALAPAGWALFPAAVCAALGSSLAIPALTALLSARSGRIGQATLMGALAAALSVTQIGGPAGSGLAFDRAGPAAPFLLGAALAGCALAVLASDR